MHRSRFGEVLEFLAPGIVHSLSNSLFAASGNAQVLSGSGGGRERSAIREAADQANHTLEVMRALIDRACDATGTGQAGILLQRVCQVGRVPLRDYGVALLASHSSTDAPVMVNAAVLIRSVGTALLALTEQLPSGYAGELTVDLASQNETTIELRLTLQSRPSFLPFPLDLAAAIDRGNDLLAPLRAQLSGPEPHGSLRLTLPVTNE